RAGVRLVGVEAAEQLIDLGEARGLGERRAQLAADRVALEVPGYVLADVAARPRLVAVEEVDEQLGVTAEGEGDLAEGGFGFGVATAERRREITEQPRAAEAASPDHDTVASGLLDHAHGVRGAPDVAVAEHRDARDGLLEGRDGAPVGVARVEVG